VRRQKKLNLACREIRDYNVLVVGYIYMTSCMRLFKLRLSWKWTKEAKGISIEYWFSRLMVPFPVVRRFSLYFGAVDQTILCLKKVTIFKLSVTLSNLNPFLKCYTSGKRMKFATKSIQRYPPHVRPVATLPWEITNSNFLPIFSRYGRKCKQIAF